jgi:hypothetical protein
LHEYRAKRRSHSAKLGAQNRGSQLRGRHSVLQPNLKSNKCEPGQLRVHRDASAATKLHLAEVLGQLGAITPETLNVIGRATWQLLQVRFGRSRHFLENCVKNQKENQA